ncbi:2-nitropropane dioxygenase [Gluconacetobacter diazotrophicus PA1 5]|uniref:2-nitropropane dioxygenase n=1 Tax=Gluconacetobacter diazotrophicus (strain ATCC 49037 / DSM 5601 / CCUG 37298 / CIP 103539 / LMG 7603 / PAl5) TaxID=272568 RepID=A9HF38_GLUDA|nr:nitronate monooxygenase [Gluconacetobacter diazotrophicus]ACI51836.1 2-nitropropane dioxygenase [Gluconacetobacter diazotrophicus PA1 5]TWB11180.1 nitronate monooxygenase [Gluconacetobacter diazotrophicus]CAP55315.1 2-nitropropane dioxygenase [Gluconacetobacter diazotrophicus PA1 5]
MKAINAIRMGGVDVLPLIEGGKGVSVSTGISSGHWAAAGGAGTVSIVNADSYDEQGRPVPQVYHGRTRRERHEELIRYAIRGGVAQARIAHDLSGGRGRVHANILWEMGGAEDVITGVLEEAPGLIHGLTCGAGMPYRLSGIAMRFGIHYYPIVSSARAFNALWKRSFHKSADLLGGVVYEDPWRAGGHNGLSNTEDPGSPEDPFPRVLALRKLMRTFGLDDTPIIMAGGVWWLEEWQDWIDSPELGPIAFQFGTRPLLTQESPIPDAWKRKLLTLKKGDVFLNRFSPTGFYSSAVNNPFLRELQGRSERQVAYSTEPVGEHTASYGVGARARQVFMTEADREHVRLWELEGYTEAMRTPDSTLIFVTKDKAQEILTDQVDCMGCLSECRFSNWSQRGPNYTNGHKADPRSFCIQKTLQAVAHAHGDTGDAAMDNNLMFGGTNAWRFGTDPFYANGFVPTVGQLVDRILTGR